MMCFKCNLIPFKICCASWIENKSFICSDSCVWASAQTTIELAPSPSHFYCIVTCGANQLEPIWPPAHLPPHLGLSITAFDANLNCISPLFPAQQLRFALRDQWRPPVGRTHTYKCNRTHSLAIPCFKPDRLDWRTDSIQSLNPVFQLSDTGHPPLCFVLSLNHQVLPSLGRSVSVSESSVWTFTPNNLLFENLFICVVFLNLFFLHCHSATWGTK